MSFDSFKGKVEFYILNANWPYFLCYFVFVFSSFILAAFLYFLFCWVDGSFSILLGFISAVGGLGAFFIALKAYRVAISSHERSRNLYLADKNLKNFDSYINLIKSDFVDNSYSLFVILNASHLRLLSFFNDEKPYESFSEENFDEIKMVINSINKGLNPMIGFTGKLDAIICEMKLYDKRVEEMLAEDTKVSESYINKYSLFFSDYQRFLSKLISKYESYVLCRYSVEACKNNKCLCKNGLDELKDDFRKEVFEKHPDFINEEFIFFEYKEFRVWNQGLQSKVEGLRHKLVNFYLKE